MSYRAPIVPDDYPILAEMHRLCTIFRDRANGHLVSYGLVPAVQAATTDDDRAQRKTLQQQSFANFNRQANHRDKNPDADALAFDVGEGHAIDLCVIDAWLDVVSRVVDDGTLKTFVPDDLPGIVSSPHDIAGRLGLGVIKRLAGTP